MGYRGVAKLGIALGSGPRGQGFESPHSDHKRTVAMIQIATVLFNYSI